MSIECKALQMSMNFDMSGMVQPCNQLVGYFLKDKNDRHYNVLTDDPKDIWLSQHRKELVDAHKNGVRHPACRNCWEREDAGIESTRQKSNKVFKDVQPLDEQPKVMIIKPGNLCNNACRSCNPHTSSMWYKTDYALNNQGKTFKEYLKFFDRHKTAYTNNSVLEERFRLWEDNIIFWDMYGGEPLIIPLFWKVLDRAVSSQTCSEKQFQLHTNGMVYNSGLVEKLSRFKESSIGFSIDAIGAKNDYIRYGSKWQDINENLIRYMDDCAKYENVSIKVRATITPWNLYHYDENYDYFKKLGIVATGVWCDDKPWNDVRYLPQRVKEAILEKLNHYESNDKAWLSKINEINKWLPTEPKNYQALQHSFMHFNQKIDKIRNEKFKDVFQEYSKLF